MFNEDNFYLAYKVCEALNSHETMVKFAEWEVAYHASKLAYLFGNAKNNIRFQRVDTKPIRQRRIQVACGIY